MPTENLLARIPGPGTSASESVHPRPAHLGSLILDNLAEGVSDSDLLVSYPQLAREDIRAALAYDAAATREHVVEWRPAVA